MWCYVAGWIVSSNSKDHGAFISGIKQTQMLRNVGNLLPSNRVSCCRWHEQLLFNFGKPPAIDLRLCHLIYSNMLLLMGKDADTPYLIIDCTVFNENIPLFQTKISSSQHHMQYTDTSNFPSEELFVLCEYYYYKTAYLLTIAGGTIMGWRTSNSNVLASVQTTCNNWYKQWWCKLANHITSGQRFENSSAQNSFISVLC